MPLYALGDLVPTVDPAVAYISPHAILVGDVRVGPGCTIFDHVVIEGDIGPVVLGANTNVQSGTCIHTVIDVETRLGAHVTVGHRAVVHGAVVEDLATVGIGAIVGARARVGRAALLGEGAVVAQNAEVPPHALAVGVPARVVKQLGPAEEQEALWVANHYVEEGRRRARDLRALHEVPPS